MNAPRAIPARDAALSEVPHESLTKAAAAVIASPPTRRAGLLCSLCFAPTEPSDGAICGRCRDHSTAAASSGPQHHTGAGSYADRLGSRHFRPPKTRRRSSWPGRIVRTLVLGGLAAAAVYGYHHLRPESPSLAMLGSLQIEPARVSSEVRGDIVHHFVTTLDLALHRADAASAYDTSLTDVYDVRQQISCDAAVGLVDRRAAGAVFDIRSTSQLDHQEGSWKARDGSVRELFTWTDRGSRMRIHTPSGGGLESLTLADPLPGRDAPPFFVISVIGPPDQELAPGNAWTTRVSLPVLALPEGGLVAHDFDCRFVYRGKRVMDGRQCVVLQLSAAPEPELNANAFGGLESARGRVIGALAFDATTGILVEADLDVDMHAERGAQPVRERVSTSGRIRVRHR